MFKRMLQISGGNHQQVSTSESNGRLPAVVEPEKENVSGLAVKNAHAPALLTDFEQLYQSASARPPRLAYGVLKVAEMLNSQHLAGLKPEFKRAALLMALEAGGAKLEDILQDAIVRQRILNEYEEARLRDLQNFEAVIEEQNRALQAEMERVTSQYMARMQSNLDEVARAQDNFRVWQKRKHQEAQGISDAANCCVPEAAAGLTVVLERASAATAR